MGADYPSPPAAGLRLRPRPADGTFRRATSVGFSPFSSDVCPTRATCRNSGGWSTRYSARTAFGETSAAGRPIGPLADGAVELRVSVEADAVCLLEAGEVGAGHIPCRPIGRVVRDADPQVAGTWGPQGRRVSRLKIKSCPSVSRKRDAAERTPARDRSRASDVGEGFARTIHGGAIAMVRVPTTVGLATGVSRGRLRRRGRRFTWAFGWRDRWRRRVVDASLDGGGWSRRTPQAASRKAIADGGKEVIGSSFS